jgi:predicted transcriptional regulator of viral defense system
VAIRSFLETHEVFTSDDFTRVFGDSQTDRNLLSRAVRKGRVEQVRRGLDVSRAGRFAYARCEPFDIASAWVGDAVFGYLSALQLHGVLHNVVFRTQFFTGCRLASFRDDGRDYLPYWREAGTFESEPLLMRSGRTYQVTTREQTLIDCLAKPGRAGGTENVLRSLAGLAYLDVDKVVTLVADVPRTVRARIGWVLQLRQGAWNVTDAQLDSLRTCLGAGPYYFDMIAGPGSGHWVNDWNLYLPDPAQELAQWLNP